MNQSEEIVKAYASGLTLEQVGRRFDVTGTTVRNYVLKHGVTLRNPKRRWTPEEKEMAISLFKAGFPKKAIAKKLGRNDHMVGVHLEKAGFYTGRRGVRGDNNPFYRGKVLSDSDAIQAVYQALKKGKLQRPDFCQWCREPGRINKAGRSTLHAHHYDYNKPLDVIFLCRKCHHQWHEEFEAIPKRHGQLELEAR